MSTLDDSSAAAVQVPSWLPGETLFGWCARYHHSYGYTVTDTGKFLFGREHAARMQDLPVGLRRFGVATRSLLGDPIDILRQRTIVGVHWPFLSFEERSRTEQAALSSDGRRFFAPSLCRIRSNDGNDT